MSRTHPERATSANQESKRNHAPRDSELLRQRLADVRSDLQREIAHVSREVQNAKHLQYYVKRFPFLCFGAAALVGYALIPTRKPAPIVATDEQIKELAETGKLHIVSETHPIKNASISQRAALALGTAVARAGMAYVGKAIGQQGRTDE